MKVSFCIEKKGGLTFFGKRLSRDQELIRVLLKEFPEGRILCSPKSLPLFEGEPRCVGDENYLNMAKENDLCWVEFDEIPLREADEIFLFFWNRSYPADRYFDPEQLKEAFRRVKRTDFAGSSHEKITMEHYERRTK